jgi:hypothetical protein
MARATHGADLAPSGPPRWTHAASRVVVDLTVLGALTVVLGLHAKAFTGFPKGYDAYGHVAKVHMILATFPHVNWNDAWYMGVPSFRGSYPPLHHLLIALLVWLTGGGIPHTIVLVGAASVLAQVFAVYGTVLAVTSNRLAGLVAGFLFAISPALWSELARSGFYPRMLGLAFAAMAVFGTALYARRPSRLWFAATALALGAALSTHPVAGVSTVALATALVGVAPGIDRAQRIRRMAALVLVSVGLAAFFYLPLVIGYHSQRTFALGNRMPLRELFMPANRGAIDSLPPALIPLTALMGLVVFKRRRRRKRDGGSNHSDPWTLRVALVCAVASAAWLAYAVAGRFGTFWRSHAIYGLQPKDVLVYMAWMLSIAFGVLVGTVIEYGSGGGRLAQTPVAVAISVAALLCLAVTFPRLPQVAVDYNSPGVRALIDILPPDASGHQYRIGASTDDVTEWLNAVTLTPQIRGYQVQAVLHLKWQTWLERTLSQPATAEGVTTFLLDWNAVKWLYAGPTDKHIAPFAADPTHFEFLSETKKGRRPFATFQYTAATPILSATAVPTTVVIGGAEQYDTVFRSLAPSDADSRQVVPIRGGKFVDDFSAGQLRAFDEVELDGATAHSPASAAALLTSYVRGGGGLTVEAGTDPALIHALAGEGNGLLPVTGWLDVSAEPGWGFAASSGPLTEGVDVGRFGPLRARDGSSWPLEAATGLAPEARAVLLAGGWPVVVSGTVGAGRVVWDGLNLPALVADTGNIDESAFMARLLTGPVRPGQSTGASGSASYRNPEWQRMSVRSGSGVLFKENWTANWSARLNGNPVTIYQAGPDMMFVPLPPSRGPVVVDFRYGLTAVERVGFGLTFLTLLTLALYAAGVSGRIKFLR